jgi:DNA polymerase V
MKRTVFALIDCNNFFVSCERVFRPDLESKPVIVLSSNDGCAVARSNEAKDLGIPMAAPVFKYRPLLARHNVVQFSANFELYGDISKRITHLLTTITPKIEVYSVDESFLDLGELPIEDYAAWGREVRRRVLQWIGVPVSIGIATSKTLAKLASDRAKKDPELGGVLNMVDIPAEDRALHLQRVPVQDVWGVGWRLSPRFRAEGVSTALALSRMRPARARQLMGIHGARMVAELNGVSCLPLEREGRPCKSIAATRTFGEDTSEFGVVEAAIATFTARAGFKLRRSHQVTRRAALFLTTNKHKPGYRRWTREVKLPYPTNDTGLLVSLLVQELRAVYNPDASYHRAGIMLYDFAPGGQLQTGLLGDVDIPAQLKSRARMQAIDGINRRFGRGHIRYAAEMLGTRWEPRHNMRSPRYTTVWDELPVARIR